MPATPRAKERGEATYSRGGLCDECECLHAMLEEQSRREGMSLNQFSVFALTRQTVLTHVTD